MGLEATTTDSGARSEWPRYGSTVQYLRVSGGNQPFGRLLSMSQTVDKPLSLYEAILSARGILAYKLWKQEKAGT